MPGPRIAQVFGPIGQPRSTSIILVKAQTRFQPAFGAFRGHRSIALGTGRND